VAAPWSRLFKTIALILAFRARLKWRIPGGAAEMIDHLVLHDSNQPGAFRAAAGVSLMTTHACEQSFLQ
jgi:hypothetical protein